MPNVNNRHRRAGRTIKVAHVAPRQRQREKGGKLEFGLMCTNTLGENDRLNFPDARLDRY